jgi:hypothetical protein
VISFKAHVMAVERVERRLREVTAALDRAGLRYAVVGGNAVAAWVGRVDPGATRATKDVDLLLERASADRAIAAIEALGFTHERLRDLLLFVDPEEPSRKSGVRVVWAGERVRPSYALPTPGVDEAVRDPEGFLVLDLPALVRMKLTSFRDIDRVHVADMLSVGLIDGRVRATLPEVLRERLAQIEAAAQDD